MDNIKRYIITGAPGTGKSSVIEALRNRNYQCFDEVSRVIIKEQQLIDGDLLPWANLLEFAKLCFKRMLQQVISAKKGINFYDRALPDILAYINQANLKSELDFKQVSKYYELTIFYFPIWEDIYTNDPQRPENLTQAKMLDHHLQETYQKLGFKLCTIPKTSVRKRADFIENQIKIF